MANINIPLPELQIDFYVALSQIRRLYLQDALSETVAAIDLSKLDKELSSYVPQDSLKALAKRGLRGELVFPVPYLLETNPYLLGYYRLLLGFSRKEFYKTKFGVSRFESMEKKGTLTKKNREVLPELCKGLIRSAVYLIEGIGVDRVSREMMDDLTLLTVGPQLRGGENVKKGIAGILVVFRTIYDIVKHAAISSSENKIEILNAAGRNVLIELSPDPDIVIREEISKGVYRNIIAIEVKGGMDFSNIHNRVGEAEKSHQKARAAGYTEFWTVLNTDRIDMNMVKKESPTTNRFYQLSALKLADSEEYKDFKDRVISLTGIPST